MPNRTGEKILKLSAKQAKTELVIRTEEDRQMAVDAVLAIRGEPVKIVTIGDYKNDRTAAQNRTYWGWMTDLRDTGVNEHAGNDKLWWHTYFKENALLNIYIRDNVDGTAETMSALYQVKIQCDVDTYNQMKRYVINNISTTSANVAQFCEYLTDIQRWCGFAGIVLRTDSPDYKLAMGIKGE